MAQLGGGLIGALFLSNATSSASAQTDLTTALSGTYASLFSASERSTISEYAAERTAPGWWSAVGGEWWPGALQPAPRRGGETWSAGYALELPRGAAGRIRSWEQGVAAIVGGIL